MRFEYNDGGRSRYFRAKNVGDCATRAIANATGADYLLVYNALRRIAGKSVRNGCRKGDDRKLLALLGWEWHPTMGFGTGCTTHLTDSELPSEDPIVVQVSGHLTCVRDGALVDTYDCSRGGTRCIYGYWTPRNPRATFMTYESILKEIIDGKL